MLAHDRQKSILDILDRQNSVRTHELVSQFGVSLETIRRDLEGMEAAGLLKRVHGGAVLDRIDASPITLESRQQQRQPEKREIGNILCRYLREGQSIALDAGTTTLEVARVLKQQFREMIVFTNSLDILNELSDAKGFSLISPGGCFNPAERSFIGELAESAVGNFHVDTAILTVSGISLREGFTDYGFGEVSFKKRLLATAREIMVAADSQKFDTISLIRVCALADVHRIITDAGLPPVVAKRYRDANVEIVSE